MKRRRRFGHDVSAYERPTLGWRCGRAALWGAPCERGPSAQGACGGEAGCAPRRTLAIWRGRLTLLTAALAVALIGAFSGQGNGPIGGVSALDPGPLSAPHAHFTLATGCAACHAAYGQGPAGWWKAFASRAAAQAPGDKQGLSGACAECHGFGGKERLAHNQAFEKRAGLAPTDCLMCHSEHKGRQAGPSTITEAQCQACHERKIGDFASNHPPLPAGFPYVHAKGIRFSHASHMAKHFADPKLARLVPAGGCVGCHEVRNAGRTMRAAGFDAACAGCHGESIAKRDFVMFRWPEIEKNEIAKAELARACGVSVDEKGAFSAVSVETPTALAAYLLKTPADDVAAFSGPAQKLIGGMMRDGVDAMAAAIAGRLGAAPERLLAGFNSEQARAAACAWAANREYEAPGKTAMAGWRAEGLEIRYAKPGHGDPVLKAWIEGLAGAPAPEDADERARLAAALKEVASPEGPGLCLKCHMTAGPTDGPRTVRWQHSLGAARPLTRFDHRPHIDLLGPERTCTTCHKLSTAPAAADATSFQAIELGACTACHAAGRVRDDCRLCHVYHQNHGLMKRMMSDAK